MPDITLIYRAQAAGLSLALELRSLTEDAAEPLNGAGGTEFEESDTEPAFYAVEIPDTLAGDVWCAIMLDDIAIRAGLIRLPASEGPHNLNVLLDRLDSNWSNLMANLMAMIGGNGDAAAFTGNALANAPFWGAEGDPSPIIYVPLGLQVDPRMRESSLRLFTGEKNYQITIPVTDAFKAPVNLTGKSLEFRTLDASGATVHTITATGGNGQAAFTVPDTLTAEQVMDHTWRLVDTTAGIEFVHGSGPFRVSH